MLCEKYLPLVLAVLLSLYAAVYAVLCCCDSLALICVYKIFLLLSIKRAKRKNTGRKEKQKRRKTEGGKKKKKTDEEGKGVHTRGERFAKDLQPVILTAFVAA